MTEHTVIIGGTSGIGLATAKRLATDGHTVTIAGRDPDRLKRATEELNVNGRIADATDRAQLDALFATTGPIDHLVVTTSATGGMSTLLDLDIDDLRTAVEGKLIAHANAIKAARPALNDNGSITLIGAGSAQAPMAGTAGLAAVNGAIETMVPTLALELAPIRVNAVSPGVIDTAWWNWLPAEAREASFEQFASNLPVRRVGTAAEIADAIAFLIGNTYAAGVVLPIDGGLRLK